MADKEKIVIIEDTALQRAIIENIVKELGYTPVGSESFNDGIRKTISEEEIKCVLLDLVLLDEDGNTVGDGLQICQEIKGIRDDLPVIIISAEDDDNAKQFAELQGADGYITKPFKVEELEAILQNG